VDEKRRGAECEECGENIRFTEENEGEESRRSDIGGRPVEYLRGGSCSTGRGGQMTDRGQAAEDSVREQMAEK
jgi:hypothetical protein